MALGWLWRCGLGRQTADGNPDTRQSGVTVNHQVAEERSVLPCSSLQSCVARLLSDTNSEAASFQSSPGNTVLLQARTDGVWSLCEMLTTKIRKRLTYNCPTTRHKLAIRRLYTRRPLLLQPSHLDMTHLQGKFYLQPLSTRKRWQCGRRAEPKSVSAMKTSCHCEVASVALRSARRCMPEAPTHSSIPAVMTRVQRKPKI